MGGFAIKSRSLSSTLNFLWRYNMTEIGILLLMYVFILIGLTCVVGIKIMSCILVMCTIVFICYYLTKNNIGEC